MVAGCETIQTTNTRRGIMKKFLFFITVMSFMGCGAYTIKTAVKLTVDGEEKEGCFEWCSDFLGLLGCDGSVVKSGDNVVKTQPAEEATEGEELGAAHYTVDANGVATESDEACETPEEEKTAKKEGPADGAASTPASAPETPADATDTGSETLNPEVNNTPSKTVAPPATPGDATGSETPSETPSDATDTGVTPPATAPADAGNNPEEPEEEKKSFWERVFG